MPIPKRSEKFPVPPFDELTLLVFGPPGAGKTRFCSGDPKALFFSTEPGQEFTKSTVIDIVAWEGVPFQMDDKGKIRSGFKEGIKEVADDIKAGKYDYKGVVIDIIDNLNNMARDAVCKRKGLAYPPENDFGKTWSEVTREWREWLGALMRLTNVRFISHTRTQAVAITQADGIKVEVDRWIPTFAGSKAAQYLDGIVNSMGFMTKGPEDEFLITFRQTADVGCKDRTDILTQLGPMPANWAEVAKRYEDKAKEMGLSIVSRWG